MEHTTQRHGGGLAVTPLLLVPFLALLLAVLVTWGCAPRVADVTRESIESDDASTLVDLPSGFYASTAIDRVTGVCYLVVRQGDALSVCPRMAADGSVVVVKP